MEYVSAHGVPGAVVESGVYKGGSAMICALTLAARGDVGRDLYLFDTFDGTWPEPGPHDGLIYDSQGSERPRTELTPDPELIRSEGLDFGLVRERLVSTGYPCERIRLIQGRVQDTIPGQAPDQIALLRLDTDFYESTLHELQHLYPRLAAGGVILVDDYPTEVGSTRAVDEYFATTRQRILLSRIDSQGRVGVKQSPS